MVSKNSFLLILKQNPGISYAALLNKIASGYSSINSARAALSRILKDYSAVGLILKNEDSFFITEKGNSLINFELKNKLVLNLNKLINSNTAVNDLEEIITQLHILSERAKQDTGLLGTARNSVDFFLSDLNDLEEKTIEKINKLNYLKKLLKKQIELLKELNFNDRIMLSINELTKKIREFEEEIILIEGDNAFLKLAEKELFSKLKDNTLSVKADEKEKLINLIKEFALNNSIDQLIFYLGEIKFVIQGKQGMIIGPWNKLNKK